MNDYSRGLIQSKPFPFIGVENRDQRGDVTCQVHSAGKWQLQEAQTIHFWAHSAVLASFPSLGYWVIATFHIFSM